MIVHRFRIHTLWMMLLLLTFPVCASALTLYGTIYNDELTVSPEDAYERVAALQGRDVITILPQASLNWEDHQMCYTTSAMNHTAIHGGPGDDTVYQSGEIFVATESITSANPLANSASAVSIGVDGASGDDLVQNNGLISVSSRAAIPDPAIGDGENRVEAWMNSLVEKIMGEGEETITNKGCAKAVGIDGGGGDNAIEHTGTLAVSAEVEESDGALFSATSAESSGILTGGGNDQVVSSGPQEITALASVAPSSVSTDGAFVAVSTTCTQASASAQGIDTGGGRDTIENSHTLTVAADARASKEAVTANSGFFSAATGSIDAQARAVGMDSGSNDDIITNKGAIVVRADSRSEIDSISAESGFVAVTLAKPQADAEAIGIATGMGDDRIDSNDIDVSTSSQTSFQGESGVVSGMAASCSTSTAESLSTGIASGEGIDMIRAGRIVSSADAVSTSVASNVTGVGMAAGPVWNGGTRAHAEAKGVNGGYGNDTITMTSEVRVTASSATRSDSGSTVIAGVSTASAPSRAQSYIMAVQGGEGNDTITLKGAMDARGTAVARAAETSVSGGGLSAGTIWDGGTRAQVTASGISTGGGDDRIGNQETIQVEGNAATDTTSISVSLIGVSVSDTSSRAVTETHGIKSGLCDDVINNSGKISAVSHARADSLSVSGSLAGGALSMDGVWNGGTRAESSAYGISGDDGKDTMINSGELDIRADARSDSMDLSFSGAGFALSGASSWDGTSGAEAQSYGIHGGWDRDTIINSARIKAQSDAHAVSTSGAVTVVGISASVSTLEARGESTGIDGGKGDDDITNTGEVVIQSDAIADQKEITASVAGMSMTTDSLWEGGTIADTWSYGLQGGAGRDTIANQGNITATSTATADASNTSITGLGVTAREFSIWDVSTKGTAHATGIHGNEDPDIIENEADIHATATAVVNGRGTTVNLLGLGTSRTGIKGTAESTGIDGGHCIDTITNSGIMTISTDVTADALNVDVNLAGMAVGEAKTIAEIRTRGIDGGTSGDDIVNKGAISVLATQNIHADGTSVKLVGSSTVDATTEALIDAAGMDGGEDDDRIVNQNTITVNASAVTDTGTVGVNLVGQTKSRAGTQTDIKAAGIMGGDGADIVENSGEIDQVRSSSTMYLSNTAFNLAGNVDGENALSASATSMGIGGGDGDDTLTNTKTISVETRSAMESKGAAVLLFGSTSSRGTTNPVAHAIGISGGEGDDTILNSGDITTHAYSTATLKNDSFTFGGTAQGEGRISAITQTAGIEGSDGNDAIDNRGNITARTTALFAVQGNGGVFVGKAGSSAYAGTTTDAAGIDGGHGDDTILNSGDIHADASGTVSLNNYSFSFGGVASTQGTLTSQASAIGIKGGEGNDIIDNQGDIRVTTSTLLKSEGAATVIFGSGSTGADVSSESNGSGIQGGNGDDTIDNNANVELAVSANLKLNSNSFSLGGTTGTEGSILSHARALGISGDDGDDILRNNERLNVQVSTSITGSSNARVGFGNARTDSAVSTRTVSTGLDGGQGADVMENADTMTVGSTSTVLLNNNSFTFIGSGSGSGEVGAGTSSMGIWGSGGDDRITNTGNLSVSADSVISAVGKTATIIGNNEACTSIEGSAQATGIHGEAGQNSIHNSGTLNAVARATGTSISNSNFGWFSDGRSEARSQAETTAMGVGADNGDARIVNQTRIDVAGHASATANAGSDGNLLTLFDGDAASITYGRAGVTAIGVGVGHGSHDIENKGDVSVTALPTASAISTADGDGADGDGTTAAEVDNHVQTYGVKAGDGNTEIRNTGKIELDNRPATLAQTYVDADTGGDAISTAIARSSVDSHGMMLGYGNHRVINDGDVRITMERAGMVTSVGESDGGSAEVADVDAFADARTHAGMTATGIRTGDGNQEIVNNGTINVDAHIRAYAYSRADGDGIDGDGDSEAMAYAGSRARGIYTGTGNSHIVNNGSIVVRAYPESWAIAQVDSDAGGSSHGYSRAEVSYADSCGILTGDGDQTIDNTGIIDVDTIVFMSGGATATPAGLNATGIQTGGGNDTIVNKNIISAASMKNGFPQAGTAISTRGGNDTVHLLGGSVTFGAIDLGNGDDTLSFEKNGAVYRLMANDTGHVNGGSGWDTVVFDGPGANHASLNHFEAAVKNGSGTYTVNALSAMDRIDVNRGTLRVASDYTMKPDGDLTIKLHSADDYGRLASDGRITLDCNLVAQRTSSAFSDGDVMDIITAHTVAGNFDLVTLPDPTELVKFNYNQDTDRAQIDVSVNDFVTVAPSEPQQTVAVYLDRVLPGSTGTLNRALGAVQQLPASEFDQAFTSLSPAPFGKGAIAFRHTTGQYTRTVQQRMDTRRTEICITENNDPLLLAYNGTDMDLFLGDSTNDPHTIGVWVNGFGQWGEQDITKHLSGFDYRMLGGAFGWDYTVGRDALVGVGIGYSDTNIDMKPTDSESDITGLSLSGYGSILFDKLYAESVLTVSKATYDMDRRIIVGQQQVTAESSHDMDVVSFMVGGGYYHRNGNRLITPFASLSYTTIHGEGFEEAGDSGYELWVRAKTTDYLAALTGIRAGYIFEGKQFFLIPELSVAWNHDFDLDEGVVSAGFKEAKGSAFSISEDASDHDSALLGLSLRLMTRKGLSASLAYTTEMKPDYWSQGVLADVRFSY